MKNVKEVQEVLESMTREKMDFLFATKVYEITSPKLEREKLIEHQTAYIDGLQEQVEALIEKDKIIFNFAKVNIDKKFLTEETIKQIQFAEEKIEQEKHKYLLAKIVNEILDKVETDIEKLSDIKSEYIHIMQGHIQELFERIDMFVNIVVQK